MSCGKQVWINFLEHSAIRDSINENKRYCTRDESDDGQGNMAGAFTSTWLERISGRDR